MKNTLEKYKILLISTGILLSIIATSSIGNFNLSKEDIDNDTVELKVAAITENVEDKKNEAKDNKTAMKLNEDNKVREVSIKVEEDIKDINNNNNGAEKTIYTNNTDIKEDKSLEPITGERYTVKKGDTLSLIAKRANISTNHLKQLNNIYSDIIYENQVLKLKGTINNSSNEVASRGGERSEDLYWLSRIIHAEAQGETYEGRVAVGNVIINRVNSSKFPNTIKGVVFDKQDGYTQFSPVIDGTIYNTPDAESIRAATDVLNGARPVGNALYFLNPRKSTNFWITQNRQYMKTIGLHDFYY